MAQQLIAGRSIRQRLTLVMGLVLLVSFVGSGVSYWALQTMSRESAKIYNETLAAERIAGDWSRVVYVGVMRTTAIAASNDAELANFFAASTVESSRVATDLLKQLDAKMTEPADREMFSRLTAIRQAYIPTRDAVAEARKAGDGDKARQIMATQYTPAADAYIKFIGEVVGKQRAKLDAAAARMEVANGQARMALIVFALGAVAIGVLLMVWLSRSITRPLEEAGTVADAIGRFDLTHSIEVTSNDETGRLLASLQTMQAALVQLVGEVQGSTDSIGTASSEIAAGNQDLSVRTEQTASNLQQAAQSMMELTGTVRQTAESAITASKLASSAAEVAQRGGKVVSQVVATMDEISSSSRQISDIIGTIDGIAFQTNILALNAAVEAARAGEQGRGFAVVASEVRSLAQRSAEAAKQIKQLIGASVERVESGTNLVRDAGSTMGEIVASVQRVNDIIGEISAASREQSSGIDQVNGAMGQLDQMTQQNAALVEQAAAAAGSLRDQSGRLSKAISVFKLHGGHAAAHAYTPPRPAPVPMPARPALAAVRPPVAAPAKSLAGGGAGTATGTAKKAPAPAVARLSAPAASGAAKPAAAKAPAPAARPPAAKPAAFGAGAGSAARPAPGKSQPPAASPASSGSAAGGSEGDWESF
ncbi:MAG: methyl-accepting chemotaxis protein [Pseudomonadota bacterium]